MFLGLDCVHGGNVKFWTTVFLYELVMWSDVVKSSKEQYESALNQRQRHVT